MKESLEDHKEMIAKIGQYVKNEASYINSLAFRNVNRELRSFLIEKFEKLKKDHEFYQYQYRQAKLAGKKSFDRDKYLIGS